VSKRQPNGLGFGEYELFELATAESRHRIYQCEVFRSMKCIVGGYRRRGMSEQKKAEVLRRKP
jgi:hypothetical protein